MKRSLVLAFAVAIASVPIAVRAPVVAQAMHDGMRHDAMTLAALPNSLQGKPVVVRIHADWCPACKATAATYAGVQKSFADKATFVQFDVTDAKTAAASADRAKSMGLAKLYDADKAETSTVAVVNPKTGVVTASFYNDNDPADYAKAIDAVRIQLGTK